MKTSCRIILNTALGGELALATRGAAPEYAIILPSDAHPAMQYAAEELRDFAEQLTGVRLAIVVGEQGTGNGGRGTGNRIHFAFMSRDNGFASSAAGGGAILMARNETLDAFDRIAIGR